ncbi:MAG: FtsX-like permease family protein [Betaproteobacteria bacterium]
MNLARLAFAYARRRPLATLLNVLLLAVGVATIALVILLARELETRLAREAAGIDLVVGAKGSPLQLILAGIYHADVPPGNVPLAAIEDLRRNPLVREVIPLALGDSFRGWRIVGTEPAFVAHYGAVPIAGALWAAPMEAVLGSEVARASGLAVGSTFTGSHGLAEGGGEHGQTPYRVVGVLAPTGFVVDRLVLTGIESVWEVHEAHHGDAADVHAEEARARRGPETAVPATAAAPTKAASPSKPPPHNGSREQAPREPAARGRVAPDAAGHDDDRDHDRNGREVTLALVGYATPLAAVALPRAINAQTALQAASPAYETARLLTVFGVGADVIRGFALLLIGASALGLFVALTQALDERRYDLAIMRALGATRSKVVGVLLLESVFLAAFGLAGGLVAAHLLAASIGSWLPAAAPLATGARVWRAEEWGVVALALAAGILATLVPAWRAYRLDVAATLADG